MVGVSRVRHHSWPFWRAPTHRAVAHASAARSRHISPHRRCTRFAQVLAESAEVEAADIARSAARQTVKSHGPSRRPGRRVLSPNRASRRGSKQALHSLAHLVLLSLASGFDLLRDAPVTSDGGCSGGSCGVGRRQLSGITDCDHSWCEAVAAGHVCPTGRVHTADLPRLVPAVTLVKHAIPTTVTATQAATIPAITGGM